MHRQGRKGGGSATHHESTGMGEVDFRQTDSFTPAHPDAPVRRPSNLFRESGRQFSRAGSMASIQGEFDMILSPQAAAAAQSGKFNRGTTHAADENLTRRESRLLLGSGGNAGSMPGLGAGGITGSMSDLRTDATTVSLPDEGSSGLKTGFHSSKPRGAKGSLSSDLSLRGSQPETPRQKRKKPTYTKGDKKKLHGLLSLFKSRGPEQKSKGNVPMSPKSVTEVPRKVRTPPASPRGKIHTANSLV